MSSETLTPWISTLEGVRPTHIDYEKVPPFEFVKRRAVNEPDDPAMIFAAGKKSVSYGELLQAIKQLAVFLTRMGVNKGDRVCVLLPNTPHYVISHYAILSIGAVVVQGNPIYTTRELKHQIEDSGARGIISLTLFQDKVMEVKNETGLEFVLLGNIADYMKPIIAFLGKILRKLDDPKLKPAPDTYLFRDTLRESDIQKFVEAKVDLDDIALLQYTGGTLSSSILVGQQVCQKEQC
jgi:long-chain acyl-CoA synthetase